MLFDNTSNDEKGVKWQGGANGDEIDIFSVSVWQIDNHQLSQEQEILFDAAKSTEAGTISEEATRKIISY